MKAEAIAKDYLPYFNSKLYETLSNTEEELSDEKSYTKYSDDSSTNISVDTIDSMDEDETKFIPHNLLDICPVPNSKNLLLKQMK